MKMDSSYLSALADALPVEDEVTLGATDSAVTAASLRLVAAIADAGLLASLAMVNASVREHIAALWDLLAIQRDDEDVVAAL
ncbi:hypothetical protein CCR97_09145 [Rhodoplanes elegans]|nr:hypothetical protein [Rhodoplanes elegans]